MSVGDMIRVARENRGLSQDGLSRLLAVSAGRKPHNGPGRNQVYRWETNKRGPKMWRPHIERVLAIDLSGYPGTGSRPMETTSERFGAHPRNEAGAIPLDPVASLVELLPLSDRLAQADEGLGMALDRRMVLTDGGGLALSALVPEALPRAVAPEAVGYFRRQLVEHWRADSVLDAEHLIQTATMQARLISNLASAAEGDLRRQLWQISAGFTGLITWLWQDAGKLDRASMWGNLTLELAHRALDDQLIAHALTNRSMIGMDQGDGASTVELAAAALAKEKRLCAKVRVQALQQAAHGYALKGDRAASDRLLDEAELLIGRIDDDFPWGNAPRTPHYLEIQRATCYTRLRLGDEAVRLWERIMPLVSRRNSGVFNARRAAALADSGRPDEAFGALGHALIIAKESRSVRLRWELETAWLRLSPWHHAAPGRQARELLDDLGLYTAHEG